MRMSYIVVTACFFLLSCGEQRAAQFASASVAIASKEAERGWVPRWLPLESRQIQIEYNMDTNEIWLRFTLPQTARMKIEDHTRKLSDEEIEKIPFQKHRGVNWWPEGLIQQQPSNDGALNAFVYRGLDNVIPRTTFIAFDRDSEHVYVWQEYK